MDFAFLLEDPFILGMGVAALVVVAAGVMLNRRRLRS
jgi:hypothetical protein